MGGLNKTYVRHMDKEKFKVVAVAEPIKEHRDRIKNMHEIPDININKCK